MALTSLYQTADAYLLQILDRIQQLGSKISDFNTGSAARTFYEGTAVALSAQSGVIDQLRLNAYLATATGDALDAKAADSQVTRKAAVQAVGAVTITRPGAGAAVTIPAGWSPLQTVPAAGQTPVQVVTTADAVFAGADTTKTVAAVAVEGGTAGNLTAATQLLPLNPVDGFATQGGFAVSGSPFDGGIDEETDDALRKRIPIAVQGRVIGRKPAFLAAALSAPGVDSANVIEAGQDRGAGIVPAGNVEVYWHGPTSAATQVASQVAAATMSGQAASTIAATPLAVLLDVTVYCLAGVDTTALTQAVKDAAVAAVAAVGVGGTWRQSETVQALHAITEVVAVQMPFTDHRRVSDTDNTVADVIAEPVEIPVLSPANIAVTVTVL